MASLVSVTGLLARCLARLAVTFVIAFVGACQPVAVAPAQPPPLTAVEACHLPATVEKGGETLTFHWQTSVELDSPESAVLFLTSGLDEVTCEAFRAQGGGFGSSTSGLGRLEPANADALTYDTAFGPTPANPRIVLAGRAPARAAAVEARAVDGTRAVAALRSGLYLVRLNSAAAVTEILARDADGATIARLADPSGLQPPLATTGDAAASGS